jgi:23S rRNA (cytosine1962-C5)-methyltransferase
MRMRELYYTHVAPTAVVTRRGAARIRAGHPWIFRSDVARAAAAPGDLIVVRNERDQELGSALWSDASQIAIRMIAAERVDDEEGFWRERLRAALAYRESLAIDGTVARLVHGEADRLPALIVDRYGDCLVVQTLNQGTDRRLPLLVRLLVELTQPRGVLARNDVKVRRLEGLPEQIAVVYGEIPDRLHVLEGPIRYEVDLRHGQKTGLFLDQRENHAAAALVARGRSLDAFTYHGGFALPMAGRSRSVLAFDVSADAVAATRANAALNGIGNLDVREANVFDALRDLDAAGDRFDTIVLDPPAFAKNKAAVERAVAGYKEINLRALKLLAPGGHLVTCSCSYHVDEALFMAIVEAAAADARAVVSVVQKRMQARDHPVLAGVPETYYLKCFVLRKVA